MTADGRALGVEVALLAEGVDRNSVVYHLTRQLCVALLAEGVDRNLADDLVDLSVCSRPPRGGRG